MMTFHDIPDDIPIDKAMICMCLTLKHGLVSAYEPVETAIVMPDSYAELYYGPGSETSDLVADL